MTLRVSITGLSADKARIDHSDLTWGFPAPTAWAGLANALGRRVTGEDWVASCLPVIHSQEQRFGRRSPENFIKSGTFAPQGSRPEIEARIGFSLILSLPDACREEGQERLESSILDAVLSLRIAGSPIFQEGRRPVRSRADDGAELDFEAALSRTLRKSGLGYLILPHFKGSLVYRYADELGALIRSVEEGRAEERRENLFPALVGYSLISEVAQRRGGRNGMPHAFAEPVTGLVEALLNTRADEVRGYQQEGFAFVRKGGEVFVNRKYHDIIRKGDKG